MYEGKINDTPYLEILWVHSTDTGDLVQDMEHFLDLGDGRPIPASEAQRTSLMYK